jgi:hypothetical protein
MFIKILIIIITMRRRIIFSYIEWEDFFLLIFYLNGNNLVIIYLYILLFSYMVFCSFINDTQHTHILILCFISYFICVYIICMRCVCIHKCCAYLFICSIQCKYKCSLEKQITKLISSPFILNYACNYITVQWNGEKKNISFY